MKGVFMKLKPVLFILLFALVAPVNVWAAVLEGEVTKIYVATFNRAPDAGGLNFWANTSGLTIQQITKEFFKAPETQRKYPEGTTDAEFINTIYQNVFGRNAEQAGLDYWVNVLGNGDSTRDQMIMTVIEGARNKDLQVLQNKTAVGLYYVNQVGENHVDGFKFSLANITENIATVNNEKQAIDVIAANAGSLAGDIENYIAMFTSAGELSPMMDEIFVLLHTFRNGDTSVVTITPPYDPDNPIPPSNMTITADFGNGYTPEGSTSVKYTGTIVINITGISFTGTHLNANADLTGSDVKRNGELILNGSMTFVISLGMDGGNTTVDANFYDLASMNNLLKGNILLNIPAINDIGQLPGPATLTLNAFSTNDYQMDGIVTISQFNADAYDIALNVTTNQGKANQEQVSGTLRVQTAFDDLDQGDRATISSLGSLTIEDATVTVNDVRIDSDLCDGLPVSGSIDVTRGNESSTISFINCTYTIN
jgi:hypothetical protein